MPKQLIFEKKKKGVISKLATQAYYRSRFFSMFMNKFEITGLSDEQKRFFLSQMWEVGTINAYILEGSKPASIAPDEEVENPEGLLLLTPYAPFEYNIYNMPTKLTPVRLRGASFIKGTPLEVNKDCVIGWAHTSHQPIRYIVDYYVEKITEVEKTIDTNLFVHKLPRLVTCSPEDKDRVDDLLRKIDAGENALFLNVEDYNAIKAVLESGGNYIIDKLYQYKQNLENELFTILGIDNKGSDKKERLLVDEVNANNDAINQGGDCFISELEAFCERVKNVLGYTITIKNKAMPVMATSEEDYTEEEDEDDNSTN